MIVGVENLGCVRGGKRLYAGLSFGLSFSQTIRIAGPNGVGKSSLLRQICGLIPCNEGRIGLEATPALADERAALDTDKPLRAALLFWANIDGASPTQLDAAMERMALTSLADLPVRMLSTGQRKRAALARVIASQAKLWLLDEPGNGLDDASLTALGQAMDAHVAAGGAIIAASHFDLPHRFSQTLNLQDYAP
ncbi:MAG: heme ABC exporter ATP-binding protein CcmA [Sphingomonadaceae bacterium]|jgi:heme exporter protein A